MKINDKLIVDIVSLDHFGRGIAKVEDKIIFIDYALVGEKIEIVIKNIKKNIVNAKIKKIIKSSNERIEPICKYFGICGGCDLMHMTYDKELKFKKNKVIEILKKFANIDESKITKIYENENRNYYRNKVSLKKENNKIGFYKKNSNEIVEIDYCYLIDNKMNDILNDLKKIKLDNVNEIVIKKSDAAKEYMVATDGQVNKTKGEFDYLKDKLFEQVGDYKFVISANSFFQVNAKQMYILYEIIKEYVNPKKSDYVVDLYCGSGTIGIYLSKLVEKVVCVEINKDSIEDGLLNCQNNDVNNVSFLTGDVSKVIEDIDFKVDVIIVDPPRKGLDKYTVSKIINISPKKIVYVSCDPVTLARDLNILKENYNIDEIALIDMFSNTYHIESVVCLSLK